MCNESIDPDIIIAGGLEFQAEESFIILWPMTA